MESYCEIVISIRTARCRSVRSTNPYTVVYIADYDMLPIAPESRLTDIECRASQPDMHIVTKLRK